MARRPRPDFSPFYEWQDPAALDRLCLAMNADLDATRGAAENIIGHGLQPLLDAQTAADFGYIYGHNHPGVHVRLRPEPEPDFQVRAAGGPVMALEATEADRPKRKRGAEYKATRAMPPRQQRLEHEDNAENVSDQGVVEAVFAKRAKDKAAKNYRDQGGQPIRPHLVIRDNLRHDYAPSELALAVYRWRAVFPSIWALERDGRLVQLWPNVLVLSAGFPSERLPP